MEADTNSVIEYLEVSGDKSFKQTCLDIEKLYSAGIIVLRNLDSADITLSSL